MEKQPATSPTPELSRPLYVIDKRPGNFPGGSTLSVIVSRMDGMPEFDRFGERLRSDRENWLSLPEAVDALHAMLWELPQYGTVSRPDGEMAENLRRFNEEFGYEVVPLKSIGG